MTAIEPLCFLLGINPRKLEKVERQLLEAELFVQICAELKEFFRKQNEDYFRLLKFSKEKENIMLENKFVRLIIQDILSSGEYNINGIACYANTHKDVVYEVLIGRNITPSAVLVQRIIELHRSVRRDLYNAIAKKIIKNN